MITTSARAEGAAQTSEAAASRRRIYFFIVLSDISDRPPRVDGHEANRPARPYVLPYVKKARSDTRASTASAAA
jgi:hypothetical protein